MLTQSFLAQIQNELSGIQEQGLFKQERFIASAQGAEIELKDGSKVLNFCANNYLGLSSHPEVIEAAKKGLEKRGYGMSSVRFICGTQDIHKELEEKISKLLGLEDTILYAAAFDANGGVFEPLLNEQDAIISDELNHASIIDGVRLCKAKRYRYKNNNLEDLEVQLKDAKANGVRNILIVTDGVFSMDGYIANLKGIVALAEQYSAMVMVDESHASGFIGAKGYGTHEYHDVMGKIDIITGTLGKALGGAMGGFTSAKKEIIELLRQRSRPYLFSNSLAPSIVAAASKVLDILNSTTEYRDRVNANALYFRENIKSLGYDIKDGIHPIIPIMLYDAKKAQLASKLLLDNGIYAIGFFYPVVPKEQARIRLQISAAHTKEHMDKALEAFNKIKPQLI